MLFAVFTSSESVAVAVTEATPPAAGMPLTMQVTLAPAARLARLQVPSVSPPGKPLTEAVAVVLAAPEPLFVMVMVPV